MDDACFLQINATVGISDFHVKNLTSKGLFAGLVHLGEEYGWICKAVTLTTYSCLAAILLATMCFGCPEKRPKDPQMVGSRTLTIYLGAVSGLLYFTTDQYLPSMPQMEVELTGSQTLLSGSVQLNIFSKCVVGLIVAPLSDKIGRRPIFVTCALLLILGSFGCAFAPNVSWFLAARVIQSLGESLEPLIFAILRDCYPKPEDRLVAWSVVLALEMIGIAIGPVLGGLVASFSHWRVPFFLLSLAWAGLANYAAFCVHETAVDVKDPPSYWSSVKRVFTDRQLVTLLVAETFVLSTYYTVNANISYLTEGVYGKSTVMTSWLMGAFASIAAAGMILVTNADTDVLSTAKQWMMAFSLGSGSSFVIAAVFFSHYLWSYLGSSFLMGFTLACYLPLGVLFMETLEDIAGTAASFEVFAQAGPPSIYSALATQGIIHDGQRGLTWFQAASALLAGAVFWTTFSFRACGESSEEAEETSEDPPK
ncbi:Uncharacterized MFS-type transporter YdgK [Durusdinium trenchii]|uniref:Uncharacterized MFS-type transporter YdgK n=1 Tax=Durusdinium trenchii TaxID=1381693 RepID=A0ABP0HCJ1_9DINO